MGVLVTLMTAIKNEQYKDEHRGLRPREIRINPNTIMDLLADPEVMGDMHRALPKEDRTIMGIPIVEDEEVETWKIIMPKTIEIK